MKQDIKKKWIAALYSEEYIQGFGALRHRTATGNMTYCCLGVLCKLYLDEKGLEWNSQTVPSSLFIPPKIQVWAGLNSHNPAVYGVNLADRNDKYMSFTEIAEIIKEGL